MTPKYCGVSVTIGTALAMLVMGSAAGAQTVTHADSMPLGGRAAGTEVTTEVTVSHAPSRLSSSEGADPSAPTRTQPREHEIGISGLVRDDWLPHGVWATIGTADFDLQIGYGAFKAGTRVLDVGIARRYFRISSNTCG